MNLNESELDRLRRHLPPHGFRDLAVAKGKRADELLAQVAELRREQAQLEAEAEAGTGTE